MEMDTSGSEGPDASSGDESSQPTAELMIITRERRKTAGNRYSQVVAQEQIEEDAEDDVALLFAEAEGEDEEYNSDEADDEADMSSSDDDDQGPEAGADDLEGEQELQNQAKIDRQKKRKADMALTTMSAIRKKPKIDPTALHRAPDKPKPSKRKERVSWLPDSDAAPGRTSLRKQTVAHREIMLERLKESEDIRLKNKAQREKKERQRQAEAPKELTQADRLAEAARNERRNAKSLNRWEAKEKERAEEQAAKLAALKDRKLSGAVLTFYSSAHVYQGLKPEDESPGPVDPNGMPPRRKWQRKPKVPIEVSIPSTPASTTEATKSTPKESTSLVNESTPAPSQSASSTHGDTKPTDVQHDSTGWLAGIHEYASLPLGSGSQNQEVDPVQADGSAIPVVPGPQQQTQEKTKEEQLKVEDDSRIPLQSVRAGAEPFTADEKIVHLSQIESGNDPSNPTSQNAPPAQVSLHDTPDSQSTLTPQPHAQHDVHEPPGQEIETSKKSPVIEVVSTRNLVILDLFDEIDVEDRQNLSVFYNSKKNGKIPKTNTETCAISGQISKYRDPTSGIGYATMMAYKKIKDAQRHRFVWSSMLGCYVGRVGQVARGVPDGFVGE